MYFLFLIIAAISMGGCNSKHVSKGELPETFEERMYSKSGHFLGEGITIGGSREKEKSSLGIGVNSFLWQASLETISFIPIRSADPFGGIILTEWYTPQDKTGEQIKVDIAILSRTLSPDSLRVKVFRQVRKGNDWVQASVSPDTVRSLEDTILTKARKLKIATLTQ